jgi:hypothetical protein
MQKNGLYDIGGQTSLRAYVLQMCYQSDWKNIFIKPLLLSGTNGRFVVIILFLLVLCTELCVRVFKSGIPSGAWRVLPHHR